MDTRHLAGLEVSELGLGCMEIRDLDQAFPAGIAAGDRYLPAAMRTVGV
jgi:hypothetical protein